MRVNGSSASHETNESPGLGEGWGNQQIDDITKDPGDILKSNKYTCNNFLPEINVKNQPGNGTG